MIVICSVVLFPDTGLTYDLLAVLLADQDDVDELAMPIFTGGNKTGFDRESFVRAFVNSGIQEVIANKLIDKMIGYQSKWMETIESSFLPDDLKVKYMDLIEQRIKLLAKQD